MVIRKVTKAEVENGMLYIDKVPDSRTYYMVEESDLKLLLKPESPEIPRRFEINQELSDLLPEEIDISLQPSKTNKYYNSGRVAIYNDGRLSILYYSMDKALKEGLLEWKV